MYHYKNSNVMLACSIRSTCLLSEQLHNCFPAHVSEPTRYFLTPSPKIEMLQIFWTGRLTEKKLGLLLPNCTLSDDFLWGLHEGYLVLTLQMTPNQKPQHSFL